MRWKCEQVYNTELVLEGCGAVYLSTEVNSAQRRDNDGKRLLQGVYRLTAHLHVRLRVIIIYSKTANLVKHCTSALHAM
ncbi:hypothetical protein T02_7550 [Trichinella nativa]|uniref:Uncharacterized protein n=1 Tax=Trichinella nativa TaxID=6335 RepID=A0A0V1KM97_9BILA|nr:hypothetical protein T02_7550 [Trichinella nativa]